MLTSVTEITVSQLHPEVWSLKNKGHRFVTMTCTDLGEAHDVLYHFDKHYELRHLRLRLPHGEPLPSISSLFFAAVIVENEMQDLFGITVTGMAVDYKGRFILSDGAPVAPLNKPLGIGLDIRARAPAPAAEGDQAS